MGSPSYNTVSVGSTATVILASNPERKGCLIANAGSATLYIGMDSAVTTANGTPLAAGATLVNTGFLDAYRGAIYGVCVSGTLDIRYWEWL